MSEELISEYIDRTGIADDTKFMLDELNKVYKVFKQINNTKITLEGDASFKRAAESVKKLRTEEEELAKIQERVAAARQKIQLQMSEQAKELAKEKELLRQRNAELKNQVREETAAEGSIEKMRAALIRLQKQYDNLTDAQRNSESGEALKNQVANLSSELKKLEGETGRFQRDVGNYGKAFAGAFTVLKQELNDVQAKLNSGNFKGTALEELRKQEALLTEVTAGLGREFTSTRQESRAFQEAAQKLGISLGQDSAAFQSFRKEVGQGVDAMQDVKDSIKLAASDTKGLDNIIGAAQGLTGAFSVAQGAAALFAGENDELEKTFVRLQAAMTVLNGLQAIQQELTRKDSIFRKIALGAQALWIKMTQGATATVQAEAAAHYRNAAAIEAENAARMTGTGAQGVSAATEALEQQIQVIDNLTDAQDTLQDVTKATAVVTEAGAAATKGATLAHATNTTATEGATVAENVNQTAKKRGVAATILHTTWTNISTVAQRIWAATALKSAAATIALRAALTGGLILLLPAVAYAFTKIAEASDKASKKAEELRKAQKALSEVNVKAAASVAEVKVQISEMQTKFQLAKQGVLDKTAVLKEYNEGLGKVIGETNNLAEAEQRLIDKAPALIKFTFMKAQAEAAAELAKKAATENIEAQNKQIEEFVSGWDKAKAVMGNFLTGGSGGGAFANAATDLIKGAKEEQQGVIDETQASGERFLKLQQEFLEKAAKFAQANGLNFFDTSKGDKGEDRKKFEEELQKRLADQRKAAFELTRQGLELERDRQKAFAEMEGVPQQARIAARLKQLEIEEQIAKGATAFELNELQIRTEQERKKSKTDITDKKILAQVLQSIDKTAADERAVIEANGNAAVLKLRTDYAAAIIKLNQDIANSEKQSIEDSINWTDNEIQKGVNKQIQDAQNALDSQLNRAQYAYNEELRVEMERYNKGEISREEYEKRKAKIEESYNKKSLLAQIAYYTKLVEMVDLPEDAKKEALAKLREYEQQLLDDSVAANERANKEKEDSDKEYNDKKLQALQQLQEELKGLVFDLFTGSIDKEKQRLENEILLLDEKAAKDKETAAQSILNADEREKAIAIIEARAEAQKAQMERRKRQLDLERARFERARAIADIIQNTAKGIAGALAEYPGPPGIALAAIIGAMGAAQVARVIAQPLPKFKHGKGEYDNYEGLAVVGDGGRKEAIIREGGSIEVTPARDTLTWVGRNDIIHPDADKFFTELQMQMANKKVGAMVANYQGRNTGPDLSLLSGGIDRMRKDVVRAVKNIPQTNIQVQGVGKRWISSKDSFTEFI